MEGRQVARKVWLKDLTTGTYVRVEGEWEPNFIQTHDGKKFSRANIVAVVASEPVPDMNFNSFIIDDGTARISVRIFGETKTNVKLGEVVLVIGRPREFNRQIYLVPEIIKKIEDKRWIQHRKLELGDQPEREQRPVEEPKQEAVEADTDIDKILQLIQKLDKGDGADTEDVIIESKDSECEKIINNLLKEGEIFEITSGRLKVLE